MTLQVAMAAASRHGQGRPVNEDALGVNGWAIWSNEGARSFPSTRDQHFITDVSPLQTITFAVADGLGGVPGAQQASLLAVEAITGASLPDAKSLADVLTGLQATLRELQGRNPQVASMGAVAAGVTLFADGSAVCFNVGDARAYYTHVGSLLQASRDDVELMPFATRSRLTKWLGQPELDSIEPWRHELPPSDQRWILLCTDGLYSSVPDETLQEIMVDRSLLSPVARLQRLVSAAGSTTDDASLMVIHLVTRKPPEARP